MKYNLTVQQTTATTLRVSGLPHAIERAFAVSLHAYQVPPQANAAGYTFHAPLQRATIPPEIAGTVSAVVGLDTRPRYHPSVVPGHPKSMSIGNPLPAGSGTLNPPGSLTVTDFAKLYDVEPLYGQGISGQGRTIGIMSLANFAPSDAYAYWSAIGLSVKSNRIRVINVDGGPGAASDASGSVETTLDVEQSGGVAPGADILVYLAPNTSQAFVDVFATAIDANKADSLSISWGEWEWFDNLDNNPVIDPTTDQTVSSTQAVQSCSCARQSRDRAS
jgi:subtilase family serine protease